MTAPGSAQKQGGPTPDEIARQISNLVYLGRNLDAQGLTLRDVWGGDDDA